MQQAPNHLLSWLDHLRILMPPRHVTLVGAGNGSGPWVQWLLSRAVPSATLVEADDALIHPLQATVAAASGAWRVRKQVIGPETATVTFHVASVSSESGLLEPESLRSLWPNLKTRQKQTRQAITLDELLQDDEQSANWLIVDCWPAQPLLQGGQQALSQMDVLIVRTTMGADTPDTLNPAEVESALTEAGFRQIAADAGRHPGVGHALYVREPVDMPATQAALAQCQHEAQRLQEMLASAQADNARATEDHQQALQALSAANAREKQLTQELNRALAAVDAEQQNKASEAAALQQLNAKTQIAVEALAALRVDYEKLQAKLDEFQQAAAEKAKIANTEAGKLTESLLQTQKQMAEIEQQAQLTEAQYKLQIADLENQRQQLESTKVSLEIELEATRERLTATEQALLQLQNSGQETLAQAEKKLQDRNSKIDLLEKQIKQLQESETVLRQKQRASLEQFARAEAQLELMKDLLSRHSL